MTRPNALLAIASGKGGVGKTWLSITLAQSAARAGLTAIVLDGDMGLANVDIQLGVAPTRDLSAWTAGEAELEAIVQPTSAGFDLIPGASGTGAMSGMSGAEIARLAGAFSRVAAGYDLGLIDVAAGVEAAQLRLAGAAGRCLLVITEDPTSLTDGYAFVKMAQRLKRPPSFEVVVNMAETAASGAKAHAALANACGSFLKLTPPLAGVIRHDKSVAAAIRRQTPLLDVSPASPAAKDASRLLDVILRQPAEAA